MQANAFKLFVQQSVIPNSFRDPIEILTKFRRLHTAYLASEMPNKFGMTIIPLKAISLVYNAYIRQHLSRLLNIDINNTFRPF
jgi:hypothetical protein